MTQAADKPETTIARETLWSYTGLTEEQSDKDFFAALEELVAREIAHQCNGTRIWVGRELRLQIGPYTIQARLSNVEPMLAIYANEDTVFLAKYHARTKDEGQETSRFVSEIIRYPNERMETIFNSLVGLDEVKLDLLRKLILIMKPKYLNSWIEENYRQKRPQALAQIIKDRYPLFLFEGEVGSGKTALARSVGSRVAKQINSELVLFVINAQVRGGGHVGEVTQNISRAFDEAERCQEREQVPVMILIDEADSLAQSRGSTQTHHEDDAGVNTLIQRIDRLRGKPIAVFFATNLAQSLDSAILRRATASYHFERPAAEQRNNLFRKILANTGIDDTFITELVAQTEARPLPGFGEQIHRYTYSDISQRLLPRAIEEALYDKQALSTDHLLRACQTTQPTPEMRNAL